MVDSCCGKLTYPNLFIQDSALPHFHGLLTYLDELRKCALHSKSQERALLASLMARKATMSLPFSHAYASSMVRAGEALGHGELFEVVQNEEVSVSTMIPYDVFTDESGAWEDPCRPVAGYTKNLSGDDLMRRAHARAMIQKSLKKLQDRHNAKGGTPSPGPYIDPLSAGAADTNKSPSVTPKGSLKRRSSFLEPSCPPGTGSARATSWSLYEPKHHCAPLRLDMSDVENSPYGRHNEKKRPRALSLAQSQLVKSSPRRGSAAGRSMSLASHELENETNEQDEKGPYNRSTREIPWSQVAGIFQRVQLPAMTQAMKEKELAKHGSSITRGKTIFAPFVRRVELPSEATDDESGAEEDLRDEEVLKRHQVVLDAMKEKLNHFLAARKKTQERRKSRSK